MLQNLSTVFCQVIILFFLMSFGSAGRKINLINEQGSKTISNVLLYFVTPCLIINSFNIDYDANKLKGLLVCLLSSFLIHITSIILAHLIFRGKPDKRLRVLRFSVVFSNAGFMGLPLQQAVLGSDGVFYGSVYVAMFNIMAWTYGVICSTGDYKSLSGKRLLTNPGIIGVVIGLVFFFAPIKLPFVIKTVVSDMASLNTPLAMIIIGFYLAQSNLKKALCDKSIYLVSIMRLLLVPLLSLGVMSLLGIKDAVLVSTVTAASAPVAATTTIFAKKFDNDIELSVNIVAFTTILSIITMPVIVALSQYITQL